MRVGRSRGSHTRRGAREPWFIGSYHRSRCSLSLAWSRTSRELPTERFDATTRDTPNLDMFRTSYSGIDYLVIRKKAVIFNQLSFSNQLFRSLNNTSYKK